MPAWIKYEKTHKTNKNTLLKIVDSGLGFP